jgi:hypothetical protein
LFEKKKRRENGGARRKGKTTLIEAPKPTPAAAHPAAATRR